MNIRNVALGLTAIVASAIGARYLTKSSQQFTSEPEKGIYRGIVRGESMLQAEDPVRAIYFFSLQDQKSTYSFQVWGLLGGEIDSIINPGDKIEARLSENNPGAPFQLYDRNQISPL